MVVGAGGGDELKLLGVWDSPYVNRVQIVLNLKGLSYEYVEEDLMNKSDLLLGSNPVDKKVPVLIHNGKPIAESRVIVEYLDEAFAAGAGGSTGASVLPSDPYERAVARFWAAYVDDKRPCHVEISIPDLSSNSNPNPNPSKLNSSAEV
uniref:Glutathione S-transferase n=1 Tax=Oryza nivara TaxID=4536 RepID=A0A0E0HIC5_ORYNI